MHWNVSQCEAFYLKQILVRHYSFYMYYVHSCVFQFYLPHLSLLYRDSTVQTLTTQPSVTDGKITYQDSPLVGTLLTCILHTKNCSIIAILKY